METARLKLIAYTPEQLLALFDDYSHFEERMGIRAADGLGEFLVSDEVSPAWLARLRASRGTDPWAHGFAVVHRDRELIIGSAGFKGPPDEDGVVEIAYGILPEYQGHGYATESAGALVTFAFGSDRVRRVRAHTLPANNASARVLTKCGFTCTSEVMDPEDGLVWRWERGPDAGSGESG